MKQEPQKDVQGEAQPEPAPAPQAPAEPTQVLRPEDEALVAERLRDLGYIE